jgi:hypothetical protein
MPDRWSTNWRPTACSANKCTPSPTNLTGWQACSMPPSASPRISGRLVEAILWDGNLVVFGPVPGVSLFVLSGLTVWLWLSVLIMAGTFPGSLYFTHVPDIHLNEFRDALDHGEILLMVDVPKARVAEIEDRFTSTTPKLPLVVWAGARPHLVYKLLSNIK